MTRKLVSLPYTRGSFKVSLIAIAVFFAGVGFADPFSGMIVEGALGSSQIKSNGRSVDIKSGANGQNPTDFNNAATYRTGNIPLSGKKETDFAGRLGVGYGYTLPGTNFNLAGLLTYNVGQQKVKETATQFSGTALTYNDSSVEANRTNATSGWAVKLKDTIDLRLQPGYYIPAWRALVYGTLGYSSTTLDVTGRTIDVGSSNSAGNGSTFSPVGQGSASLNGLVLGIGTKYSPIDRLYVGIDYSHGSYNSKNLSGTTSGTPFINGQIGATFPVQWEGKTGKIKTDIWLLTVGYYFL